MEETVTFKANMLRDKEIQEIVLNVYAALEEKGYNPVNQLVGYFISGDPTYITSHKDARTLIKQIDRDEILECLLTSYISLHREG
ncbi:MAG: IreB family regulatory phosphoprotein [Tissierellia bacterium]|jgi:uncharacterized protein (UPF0297 family)|nr:IreB family regulatory phosphoprotein [Bacillota bacterium]NLL23514.1 IreB family regulatory phosphoprotein [Tissierellia bacterium]